MATLLVSLDAYALRVPAESTENDGLTAVKRVELAEERLNEAGKMMMTDTR